MWFFFLVHPYLRSVMLTEWLLGIICQLSVSGLKRCSQRIHLRVTASPSSSEVNLAEQLVSCRKPNWILNIDRNSIECATIRTCDPHDNPLPFHTRSQFLHCHTFSFNGMAGGCSGIKFQFISILSITEKKSEYSFQCIHSINTK